MQSGNKNPRLPTLINTHYTNAVVKQPTAIPFTVLCKPHLPPSSLSLSLLPPERACGSGLHTPTTTHTHTLLPFTASHTCTEWPAMIRCSRTPILQQISSMGAAGKAWHKVFLINRYVYFLQLFIIKIHWLRAHKIGNIVLYFLCLNIFNVNLIVFE